MARRNNGSNLAIGGTLTAAFVGGALVFEAHASPLESGSDAERATARSDAARAVDRLDHTAEGKGAAARLAGGDEAVAALNHDQDASTQDVDLPAAPTRPQAETVRDSGAAPESSAVEIVGDGTVVPAQVQPATSGGASIGLTFFNVNVDGGGEVESRFDSSLDDQLISRNQITGTNGDDVLNGGDDHDSISGGGGDDVINGNGGSDLLFGNDGDDQLFGGSGRDRLDGGAGDDVLDGGRDSDLDILRGGSGDDVLIIDGINDIALEADRGGDNDLLIVRDGYARELPAGVDGATFVFHENFGVDLPDAAAGYRQQLSKGIENVTFEGTADLDIFADSLDNRLTGNDGDNTIFAGAGDDRVAGGAGDDRLDGGAGKDEISGGAGDDILAGGADEDILYGEAGDDRFVIGLNDGAIDTVFDHEGANRLVLEGVTDETVEATLLGDDLYVTVDQVPVAVVSRYVGHEDALAGIDFGNGLTAVDDLLVDNPDIQSAVAAARSGSGSGEDFLTFDLSEPTIRGTSAADTPLVGTDGDDWLSGFDGKDHLFGGAGDDVLEGGAGVDQLSGGAGNDRYLFTEGDAGIDIIRDTQGHNSAELKGFDGAKIEATLLGDDLAVVAKTNVVFVVEDFVGNEDSFAGVQVGNNFIPTEDLLA